MAFYLHLPDQEWVRFVWDELAKTRPEDFPRRVASFIRLEFLSGTKKKSLSSLGLLLATRGGYPHVSQSDVHFMVMDILERKGLEFDLPRLGSILDSLIIEKTNSQFFQQILRENEDFLNHMNRLKEQERLRLR